MAIELIKLTESQVQRQIVDGLTALGYIVLETTTHVRHGKGWATGQDKGVPDLLVTHRHWPTGCWLGIEVKVPKGRPSSREQRALIDGGRVIVARSFADARIVIDAFWKDLARFTDGL